MLLNRGQIIDHVFAGDESWILTTKTSTPS